MTTDERIVRALEKLRTLRLSGYTKESIGWSYDDDSSKEDGNRVLLRLGTEKVITVSTDITGTFYPDTIEKMNEQTGQLENMVRTENNDVQKSKNTPVGVLAIPNESTSTLDLNSSWLRQLGSNQRPNR